MEQNTNYSLLLGKIQYFSLVTIKISSINRVSFVAKRQYFAWLL